jgi:pimeloyl-ACP methyl ester carboxylesterase
MAHGSREDMIKMLSSLTSDVDRQALTLELVEFLRVQSKEGFRLGVGGYIDDGLSDGHPWGFDLASIRVPVQVWHGRHDRFRPFAHGEWLSKHVPTVEAHFESGDGHIAMFIRRIPEVHRWLASSFYAPLTPSACPVPFCRIRDPLHGAPDVKRRPLLAEGHWR